MLDRVNEDNPRLDEMLAAWHAARSGVRKLQALIDLRDAVEFALLLEVSEMVAEGDSWTKVAQGLGVTRQAAAKKYRDVLVRADTEPEEPTILPAALHAPEDSVVEAVVLRTTRGRKLLSAQIERRRMAG